MKKKTVSNVRWIFDQETYTLHCLQPDGIWVAAAQDSALVVP